MFTVPVIETMPGNARVLTNVVCDLNEVPSIDAVKLELVFSSDFLQAKRNIENSNTRLNIFMNWVVMLDCGLEN